MQPEGALTAERRQKKSGDYSRQTLISEVFLPPLRDFSPFTEKQIIPQCTPEKEEAIMDALRHFKMI